MRSKYKKTCWKRYSEVARTQSNLDAFSTGAELFKKNVPVVTYEDVKPYMERVANGEPSDVISGEPITQFFIRYTL
ncbi:unnamed protein product [Brassica napus]|uniref:(rape) hypothetical protein n=1 Tax=Brassica napus TaxID=3708 RepID=A0A816JV09_BRANA|nr:unnamed protein product [Brassica napus]